MNNNLLQRLCDKLDRAIQILLKDRCTSHEREFAAHLIDDVRYELAQENKPEKKK